MLPSLPFSTTVRDGSVGFITSQHPQFTDYAPHLYYRLLHRLIFFMALELYKEYICP
jgi:hypothetical protein